MSRRGWALFATMSVIWGIPYLLIKVAVGGVPASVLVLTRVLVGALLLLPVAARRRELAGLRGHWRWLVVFALVEITVPWLLLSEAEVKLTSSMSGLLVASTPILGVLLGWLSGGSERLTLVRWTGLLAGLAGVALLAAPGLTGGGDALSIAEILVVAFCYAAGPLIASRKLAAAPPVAMTSVCLGMAAIIYTPLAAADWPSAWPSAKVLLALAVLTVVCTATAFLLFFHLIAEIGPARATVITYVNPAVAVTLGVVILGERLTLTMAGAFVLILAGSVLAARSRTARTPATQPGTAQPGTAQPGTAQPGTRRYRAGREQAGRAAPEQFPAADHALDSRA